MKKTKFVPGRRASQSRLGHIATKCGKCDRNVGEIGGRNPRQEYVVQPAPKKT